MTRDKDVEARTLVGRALEAACGSLSTAEVTEVQELLDVNENALALETLVGIFVEEHRVAPPSLTSLVIEAAKSMAMDPSRLVQELEKLEKH